VRTFGPERQTAVSGAFYFEDRSHRPPLPVRAQVRAQVLDAETAVRVSAVLTEVTLSGTVAREGRRHRLQTGEARLYVPGTARLGAEARGYAPMTLSPFLDSPNLVKTVTTFSEQDLSNWQSFGQLKKQLDNVDLVFRLQKTSP
jgi:IS30 family transposase